mmetsp:Transcript_20664/g.36437  ORF Transcript_20664/g.36437 Transcript_20664/m.36437 type:complete len:236 (+) Transcript_20664:327-1034(+)
MTDNEVIFTVNNDFVWCVEHILGLCANQVQEVSAASCGKEGLPDSRRQYQEAGALGLLHDSFEDASVIRERCTDLHEVTAPELLSHAEAGAFHCVRLLLLNSKQLCLTNDATSLQLNNFLTARAFSFARQDDMHGVANSPFFTYDRPFSENFIFETDSNVIHKLSRCGSEERGGLQHGVAPWFYTISELSIQDHVSQNTSRHALLLLWKVHNHFIPGLLGDNLHFTRSLWDNVFP